MRKIFNGFKISFFQWKTYFTQFTEIISKFEEMEYLIHYVKFEMWPVVQKFPILFSALKLKLGHNFSQLIYRFKLGTFESWTQVVFRTFPQFTKRSKIGIFEYSAGWNIPLHGWKRLKIGIFEYQIRLYFQVFPSSLNS